MEEKFRVKLLHLKILNEVRNLIRKGGLKLKNERRKLINQREEDVTFPLNLTVNLQLYKLDFEK